MFNTAITSFHGRVIEHFKYKTLREHFMRKVCENITTNKSKHDYAVF